MSGPCFTQVDTFDGETQTPRSAARAGHGASLYSGDQAEDGAGPRGAVCTAR